MQIRLDEFITDGTKRDSTNEVTEFIYKEIFNNISKREWKKYPYSKQNWGIWLHRMSSYIGKLKPAFAHLLVKYASKKGNIVFDPFCGVGTILVEAEQLERVPIGNDLNPYAYTISKAKFDRHKKIDLIKWVKQQEINYDEVDTSWLENRFLEFYDNETLKEITHFRNIILKEDRWFLCGCILGILHGHRPAHLSAITNLVIPYKPKTEAIYKNVPDRIISKIERMYRDWFPKSTSATILNEDSRELSGMKENSVDSIISSPPYFSTLDYVEDNRLRLNFLGYKIETRTSLKKELIQSTASYMENMIKVGVNLRRVLKPNHPCVFVLGDFHSGKTVKNTAKEIEKVYVDLGFKSHGIIDDEMPTNKSLPTNTKRSKLDRILILENIK